MDNAIRSEVLRRLESDYGLQHMKGTPYLRKGTCPACGKKELYSRNDEPWFIKCGRESKCGEQWHVKELFDDLFDDWSKRAPATDQQPNATARAYLEFARGFRLELIEGWFTQESYWDSKRQIGSATVRFPMPDGGYWERLIDRPDRFEGRKAGFKKSYSYAGKFWIPPSLDVLAISELWIVEGIFDAIALLHHGISAVSMMSNAPFPHAALAAIASQRQSAGKRLPKLVWALDNDEKTRGYIRKWAKQAEELGYSSKAAVIPRPDGRKTDWNDLHQRWAFIDDEKKRENSRKRAIDEARYEGDLLLSASANEKAELMHLRTKRNEFYFNFGNRLYWASLDVEKFNKTKDALERGETTEDKTLTKDQIEEKAARQNLSVSMIANCYPEVLYKQSNLITDEHWFYVRISHPSGKVENVTFTTKQLTAGSEFKSRLLSASGSWRGTGRQLDSIVMEQTEDAKVVETIDYIGYSKEHSCYVFGDLAVRGGVVEKANAEDYFEFKKLRLKTLQKSIRLEIAQTNEGYRAEWLDWLWQCFGPQGVIALAFWFGSLFAEQIRSEFQSFPFLEVTGEAGAGKSTLLMFLWKLLGRPEEEGKDPSKMSKAGLRRWLGQVSGMPLVLLEADRSDATSSNTAKGFDFDEFKPMFNGGSLGVTGMKTGGNETHEPPFRGSLVMSQNATVTGSEAILTRIVKLHFVRPEVTSASRAAVDNLNHLNAKDVSHFLIMAAKAEHQVLEVFRKQVRLHEQSLRAIREIRVERIIKNHAQLLALLDALRTVIPLTDQQHRETQQELMAMAIDRQGAIEADPEEVRTFWEVYDYLQSLSDDPVVNHSKSADVIAINLNEFAERAAEHRQKLADVATLRTLLKHSRSRPCIDINRATDSAVRAAFNVRNPLSPRCKTVKCWVFKP